MNHRLPGLSVHGVLQATIPEWTATASSRGSSQPRDWTHISYVSCTVGWVLNKHHMGNPQKAISNSTTISLHPRFYQQPDRNSRCGRFVRSLSNVTSIQEHQHVRLSHEFLENSIHPLSTVWIHAEKVIYKDFEKLLSLSPPGVHGLSTTLLPSSPPAERQDTVESSTPETGNYHALKATTATAKQIPSRIYWFNSPC